MRGKAGNYRNGNTFTTNSLSFFRQCALDASDKEIQRLQEQLAAIRSEKEALEAVLFDTQTNLEACENKKFQLEKEAQDHLVKQESLKGQITRLAKDLERSEKRCVEIKNNLTQQAGNQEAEYQAQISNLKKLNEDNVRKLTEEREKIKSSLEKRLQDAVKQLNNEKDAEVAALLERIDALQHHIDNLCQQHEELMVRAENDKQQALLIGTTTSILCIKRIKCYIFVVVKAHHDHKATQDRLEGVKRELENEKETLERLKREASSRFDQDRGIINQLKDEVNKLKAKLDETRYTLKFIYQLSL